MLAGIEAEEAGVVSVVENWEREGVVDAVDWEPIADGVANDVGGFEAEVANGVPSDGNCETAGPDEPPSPSDEGAVNGAVGAGVVSRPCAVNGLLVPVACLRLEPS